jgi:hypothetical protein
MNGSFEIRHYTEGESGRSPFEEWFNKLDAHTAEQANEGMIWH